MKTLISLPLLFLLIACSRRSDVVFSAGDDLHLLTLYKENNDFEMLYNGFNTVEGTYTVRNDTIFLTYSDNEYVDTKAGRMHLNNVLTRTVAINKAKKSICSVEAERPLFCGGISINELD